MQVKQLKWKFCAQVLGALLVTAAAGCGGEAKVSGDCEAAGTCVDDPCPAIKEGAEACNGSEVVVCSMSSWQHFKDCGAEEVCSTYERDVVGCTTPAEVETPGPGDNSGPDEGQSTGTARKFPVTSVAAEGAPGSFTMSLSSMSHTQNCGAVDGFELSPGYAAEQVYIMLSNTSSVCPVGTHGLNANCADVRSGSCAIYRRWDANNELEVKQSLAGSLLVSEQDGTCEYRYELIANGEVMSGMRSVVLQDQFSKWCSQ